MEFPFTIVFEPPSRSELRALLRMRGYWAGGLIVALTIGAIYVLANVANADAVAANGVAPLTILSQPPGASVWVDGRQRGTTPADVSVEPGPHTVSLRQALALEQQYSVNVDAAGATLSATLWRRQPGVTRLRPALPGAALADVRLLPTGDIGVSIGLPPGPQLQAWRLDPSSGALESIMTGALGARLTFAPDARHLAYLGSDIGPAARFGSAYPDVTQLRQAWSGWLTALRRERARRPVGVLRSNQANSWTT